MDVATKLRLKALDRFQQRHRPLGVLFGVLKKFSDDEGGQLAALIAYYGFISLFPLLLVFTSVLGFVLSGDPSLEQQVLKGTLSQFPLISSELEHNLTGSGAALGIGTILTLIGGLAVTNASQVAFNRIWSVPFTRRPSFLTGRLRGLGVLLTLGALTILSTIAGGFVGASNHGASGWQIAAGVTISLLASSTLFLSAFKLLTAADLRWRQLLPGGALAAALWTLLQYFGGLYVSHELKHLGPLYGSFALVLGLLAWLYLGAQLTLIAAELNVVLDQRLWPRTWLGPELLDADRRALKAVALATDRSTAEHIEVRFDEQAESERDAAGSTRHDIT